MIKLDFSDSTPDALEDGFYEGVVDEATTKTTKAGENYLSIKIKLTNNRVVFDNAFLASQNPKAVEMAARKVGNILKYGVDKSPSEFKSIADIAKFIAKVPVKIEYKNKGKNDKGYDQIDIRYKPVDSKVAKSVSTNPY